MARSRSSSTGAHTVTDRTPVAEPAAAGRAVTEERSYLIDETNRAEDRSGSAGWASDEWRDHTRIVLTPVAAPSILGLYGFFFATLLVGTHMAGWWGNDMTTVAVFPVAIFLGGVAQFLAGMWAYKARDGLATAMHGIWGGFWMAFGLYNLFVATHVLPAVIPPKDVAFGFWFIPLATITGMGALASLAKTLGMFAVLAPLATGSGFAAAGFIGGMSWCLVVAGWLFVFAAGFAWWTASAMMLKESFGRTILPTLEWKKAANIPGRQPDEPIEHEGGMPGAKVGQ